MFSRSKYHIVSGSYHISMRTDVTLEAFLSTCVGVTIVDPVNGVGGLIHLLLPEPISLSSMDAPEKYASTGLPLFIEGLMEAGADPTHMTATLAGGALIGPISHQDIHLNIGGRTADTALGILKTAGIRVTKSETGGFNTSCLELSLDTMETRIKPSFDTETAGKLTVAPLTGAEISEAVARLSPVPQSVLRIMSMIDADRFNIQEIADEVRKDQVITAKTLQLCNTAFFSGRRKIDSPDDALLLLGQEAFYKLVISAFISRFYEQSDTGYSLCQGGLYHHAVGTALVTEKLSVFTKAISPATAYTAGLIHNIGMVVLDQFMANASPLFYRELQTSGSSILSAETEILGTNHCDVGALLCDLWHFPENLTHVIRYHHMPNQAPGNHTLVNLVAIAEFLMSRVHTAREIEALPLTDLETQLSHIGFSLDQLPELIDMVPVQFFGNTLKAPVRAA